MLGLFRTLANTWLARLFFLALAAAFVGWGVAGRSGLGGGGPGAGDIATVGGRTISEPELAQQFQTSWRRIQQQVPDPSQLPPGFRQQVMRQTLDTLITQAALDAEADRLGITVPAAARAEAVAQIPAFQDPGGTFNRNIYLQVLRNNNFTESRFLHELDQDIAKQQLLAPIEAGAKMPAALTALVYEYANETRTADIVTLPFATVPPAAAPADAVLQRFYQNNPGRYTAPDYRRIKIVLLSPETIGRTLPVTDADLHAWFDKHKSEFEAEEKRSLQVITAPDARVAATLAAAWRGGADWAAMQARAKAVGATATDLADTTARGIPSPELARAAFAAAPNTVAGPIIEPLGAQLVRVVSVTPAKHADFAALRDTARMRLGAERAADLVDPRAQKLQDLFAGGARLDEVPADLGAAGAEGTLDAQGNTPDGVPAPLPATGDLRARIIADAFKAAPNDPVQLTEGPDHAWYALQVLSVVKPVRKPFDQVRTAVLADWRAEQAHHAQDAAATKLLTLVRGGQSLQQAAWGSGAQVTRTPPLHRERPAANLPAELTEAAFSMKPGEARVIETNAAFIVAALAAVQRPDPARDQAGLDQLAGQLNAALAQDTVSSFVAALRERAQPRLNQAALDKMLQQQGE